MSIYKRYQQFTLCGLCLLTLIAIIFSLHSGDIQINLQQIFSILLTSAHRTTSHLTLTTKIIMDLRLPRTLNAFTTGALLALAGLLMQVLLRNPLADPYILGISGGAAIAALISLLLGLSLIWLHSLSFLGAMISMLFVFGLSRERQSFSPLRLLLTGIVLATGWGALISFILILSPNHNLHGMLFWLMGSIGYQHLALPGMIVLFISYICCQFLAPQLNILIHGELRAKSLGIHTNRLHLFLFLLASILTACAVSIAGTIGFVGLIVPHLLRLIGLRDHRLLVPATVLAGGSLLTFADSLSRIILAPEQLPVGIITALIGVPIFLVILKTRGLPNSLG